MLCCAAQGLTSLSVAQAAGVTMCFGSDLLGDLHRHQGEEFVLRSEVLPPAEILRAATHNCARLFGTMVGLGVGPPASCCGRGAMGPEPRRTALSGSCTLWAAAQVAVRCVP